jgi:phenylalanyl-tRNA synthetase alpha subunit
VLFIERDHVVQQIAPATLDPALGYAVGMSVQVRRMAMLRFDVSG